MYTNTPRASKRNVLRTSSGEKMSIKPPSPEIAQGFFLHSESSALWGERDSDQRFFIFKGQEEMIKIFSSVMRRERLESVVDRTEDLRRFNCPISMCCRAVRERPENLRHIRAHSIPSEMNDLIDD